MPLSPDQVNTQTQKRIKVEVEKLHTLVDSRLLEHADPTTPCNVIVGKLEKALREQIITDYAKLGWKISWHIGETSDWFELVKDKNFETPERYGY